MKIVYLIELSNKRSISIDPDELPKVIQGIKSGNPVIVRQGIFNPSFFVSIVEDKKRLKEIEEDNQMNKFNIQQGYCEPAKLEPLKDIFKQIKSLNAPKK